MAQNYQKTFDSARLGKLGRVVDWSRRRLLPFRENRYSFINQYVGAHYSWESAAQQVPINLMQLAASIYTERLAARRPRVLCTTHSVELKPSALELESGVNHVLEKIHLQTTLRRSVKEAMFGIGIVKVGIVAKDRYENDLDPGEPYVDVVDLDDWVHDMDARTLEECQWMGNRYCMFLDDVRDNPAFDKQARETVQATIPTKFNEQGDAKIETLSQGQSNFEEGFYDEVNLWDIWFPRDKLVVTFSADAVNSINTASRVLRVVEWEGPEHGPYHMLRFDEVPHSVLPVPPAAHWMDLHMATNGILRKLIRQAQRQKDVTGYSATAASDAERLQKAGDGDVIRMDDPKGVVPIRSPGADQMSGALLIQLKQLYSWTAGNLDMLGGLSPQSATVGQDRLLSENASQKITDMQNSTVDFAAAICRDIAWYMMKDPALELTLTKTIPGGVSIPFKLTPENIDGDFLDYNFAVEPYSLAHKSPAERLQALEQTFAQFIQPLMPMLQSQGVMVDFQALLKLIGRYADMPELDDILHFAGPDAGGQQGPGQQQSGGQMQPAPMPAKTTRTNVRENRPGGTAGGQEAAMMGQMMGQNKQPAEAGRAFAGAA